jgi:thioredoxin-related protein
MRLLVYGILLFMIASFVCNAGDKSELKWYTFDDGLAHAKKTEKKILVDVYTDWCGWCKKMDRDVYGDKRIVDYLNQKYVLVKLNAESSAKVNYKGKKSTERGIAQQFGVTGYPTTLFFKSDGEPITPVSGFVPADKFIDILKFIGDDFFAKMNWEEFQKKKDEKK